MTRATPHCRERRRNQRSTPHRHQCQRNHRAPPVQPVSVPQPSTHVEVVAHDEQDAPRSSSLTEPNATVRAIRDAEQSGDNTALAVAWAAHAAHVVATSTPDEWPAYCSEDGLQVWTIESDSEENSDGECDDDAQSEHPYVVMRSHAHPGFDASGLRALHVARMTAGKTPTTERSLRSNTLAMRIRRSHLHPMQDPRYVSATRNCRYQIMRSIDDSVAPLEVVATYNRLFRRTPRTEVKEGMVGLGLFVKEPVRRGGIVMKYTGNRLQAHDVATLKAAMDYYGVSSDTLITIPSEAAVIDPRACGGDARYFNNSCKPNCELHEVHIGDGLVVAALSALVDLPPGTECVMKYKWRTFETRTPITCKCRSRGCEGTL